MDVTMASLGWNCDPASLGIEFGLRPSRADGYGTGPFDLKMSSYAGLCTCLAEDFGRFFDLEVQAGEVVNATYGFIFNHESPNRYDLLGGGIQWPTPGHFVANDFEYFRRRYKAHKELQESGRWRVARNLRAAAKVAEPDGFGSGRP